MHLKEVQNSPAPTHSVWLLECCFKNISIVWGKKKDFMSILIDWKLKRRAGFFPFLGLKSCGDVSRSSKKSLQGRKTRVLTTCNLSAWGLPVTSLWKCLVGYADHEDWVIKTHHHPTREIYYSPLLLIESELRFHTAKSSDLFCLLESQSLSGLRFGKCKFCFLLN